MAAHRPADVYPYLVMPHAYRSVLIVSAAAFGPLFLIASQPAVSTAAPVAEARSEARVIDFGDHRSATLVAKAWQAFEARDHEAVAAYAGRCRELYFDEAVRQQAALSAPIPATETERIAAQWALNDVGTCLYIQAQAYERDGQIDDAVALYRVLVERLTYAQCWDVKGWFWSPVDAAKGRLRAIEFERAGF